MKLMYVHGFGSSAQSGTVKLLRSCLPNDEVVARDIPIVPEEAIAMLKQMAEEEQPDIIVGTSMGGMYTEQLKGFDRILVNPAFQMGDTMSSHGMVGKLTFQNPRADGVQEFIITKAMVKEYAAITQLCFQDITEEERGRVYGLFGDEDPIVHTFDLFREHYPNAIHFHGEHRLTDHAVHNYLLPLIRKIRNKQEGVELPPLFIHFDCLHDQYMQAASSLRIAYYQLIEKYTVYIVADAPTNDHSYINDVQTWVEKYLSAPAHDSIIFTNKPQLLLGDFYITRTEEPDFMGTNIQFGSDTFKCWEDICVFFSRLG